MVDRHYTGKGASYLADEMTAKTVNLAIHLKRPILVEGEPGCGKTMLAHAVAEELGLELVKFVVKSTTQAQDLLYREDSLRRLQDAQRRDNEESRYIYPYLSLGKLGEAIHRPHEDNQRRVVLIDEIDKADIDFPNDLLGVLDGFKFNIEPLSKPQEAEYSLKHNGFGYHIEAKPGYEPIIIITSNREKRLPEPFLRRCLYVRILFPEDKTRLRDIVLLNLHQQEAEQVNQSILEPAVAAFWNVRQVAGFLDVQKKPTTSELIDWVRILNYENVSASDIAPDAKYPPFWQMLFKTMNDIEVYNAHSDD